MPEPNYSDPALRTLAQHVVDYVVDNVSRKHPGILETELPEVAVRDAAEVANPNVKSYADTVFKKLHNDTAAGSHLEAFSECFRVLGWHDEVRPWRFWIRPEEDA